MGHIRQGTVEEDILDLHRRKGALANDFLADGDAAPRLDSDTLLNLLTLGVRH